MKLLIRIVKRIMIAFSIYSRIPMPIFNWDEEDTGHAVSFLPLVGAIIGIISWAVLKLAVQMDMPRITMIALLSLLPLVVTGGFHVDGFMDVEDALQSYKGKEDKLKILKDPHIGAFSVIAIMVYSLLWLGAMDYLLEANFDRMGMYFAIFSFVRSSAGIVSIKFRHARNDGMLNSETKKTATGDFLILLLFMMLSILFMAEINPVITIIVMVILFLYSICFRRLCYKNFGGVTGDTIGYYIVVSELLLLIVLAVL